MSNNKEIEVWEAYSGRELRSILPWKRKVVEKTWFVIPHGDFFNVDSAVEYGKALNLVRGGSRDFTGVWVQKKDQPATIPEKKRRFGLF